MTLLELKTYLNQLVPELDNYEVVYRERERIDDESPACPDLALCGLSFNHEAEELYFVSAKSFDFDDEYCEK